MTADRVLLWRHGRTDFNVEHRFQGQLDIDLDDVGRAQAEAAAPRIAQYGPTRIIASDLQRAAHTAQTLARVTGIAVEYDSRFREVDAGEWQGLTSHDIRQQWPLEYAAWKSGEDVPVGGGEKPSEMAARWAEGFIHAATQMDGGVLVVTSHGAVMRAGLCHLLGLPRSVSRAIVPGFENCHWTVVQARTGVSLSGGPVAATASSAPGRWEVVEMNVGVARAGIGAEG